jgi:hypothetical protein
MTRSKFQELRDKHMCRTVTEIMCIYLYITVKSHPEVDS